MCILRAIFIIFFLLIYLFCYDILFKNSDMWWCDVLLQVWTTLCSGRARVSARCSTWSRAVSPAVRRASAVCLTSYSTAARPACRSTCAVLSVRKSSNRSPRSFNTAAFTSRVGPILVQSAVSSVLSNFCYYGY